MTRSIERDATLAEKQRKSRRRIKDRLIRWYGRCFFCGIAISRREDATLDHFVPRSRGGEDGIDNAVLACGLCNSHKRDRMPSDAERRRLHAAHC